MLVLSRKVGDALVIDESIVVEVVSIQGGKVKLGVHCSDKVSILRGELVAADALAALSRPKSQQKQPAGKAKGRKRAAPVKPEKSPAAASHRSPPPD